MEVDSKSLETVFNSERLSYVCRYIKTSERCYVPGEGIDFT